MAEAKAFKLIPHCTKDTITYEMDELVMCKDCKWLLEHDSGESECEIKQGWFPVKPEWYCADGEQKD